MNITTDGMKGGRMKLSEAYMRPSLRGLLAGWRGDATIPCAALARSSACLELSSQALNALTAARILESVPGPAGGYRLARAAETISLLDIVLAVEGPQPAFRCCEIRRCGPVKLPASAYVKPCGINAAMLRAEKAYRARSPPSGFPTSCEYLTDADPRSVAASRAFVAQHRRPQRLASGR